MSITYPFPWVKFTVVNNTDSIPVIIPSDFPPVEWDYREYTDTTPFIIPPGYPWIKPILPIYYLEK